MAKIEFPKRLKELLEDSHLQAPIRSLADRAGEILADNKLPFFPDYTDHGTDHIQAVLKSEVELVPKEVWDHSKQASDPRLLSDVDAAVIIGATLLHDIAMHLRPDGFLELVGRESRFHPLPWFKENHEGHSADRPWHELWEDFQREARRFSDRQLAEVIGEDSAQVWKFEGLPGDKGQWQENHRLIVGEFIRRHHARLAHEIAIYGFPGLSDRPDSSGEGYFPAMGTEAEHPLNELADLIGLTARSHGTSLRVCQAYLEFSYPQTPRPMGTAVLYPMALLRVADYLQIDRQRAPAVLLQLRNPQSPISVQEWQKHRAVRHIGPANDPRGKMVTVTSKLSLSLYLQLKDLLEGLQAQIDHSTAVLGEAYGSRTDLGLHQLNLATRRVHSNLQSPAFRDGLPYVPNRTRFTADPNLLTLLVEPLYGKEPSVGVRELMQNAVDAVSELEAWCEAHNVPIQSLDLPEQDGDVLIEYIKRENGSWFLRVRDRGIGMRSDTIQKYFLRAGASFRSSAEWAKDFLDEKDQPRVARAGRFGIGVFAVFLLGPSFKLCTRHAGADKSMGYTLEASVTSQLIELRRVAGLPVGTTIEVEMSSESVRGLELESEIYSGSDGPAGKVNWFCWDWPKVAQHVIRGPKPELLVQKYTCPVRKSNLPPDWTVIHPKGFDAVFWTSRNRPRLSCNGLRIADPQSSLRHRGISDSRFAWPKYAQLRCPSIAVLDSAANLPLTTQRYGLSQETVPFVDELVRDVSLSFIAHALVCGPKSLEEALSTRREHPLKLEQFSVYGYGYGPEDEIEAPFANGRLRWCATSAAMVPADPWLYTLLSSDSCLVYGALRELASHFDAPVRADLLQRAGTAGFAILPWHGYLAINSAAGNTGAENVGAWSRRIFGMMVRDGVPCLGSAAAAHVLVSARPLFRFEPEMRPRHPRFVHVEDAENPDYRIWSKMAGRTPANDWFKAQTGELIGAGPLEPLLEAWEAGCRQHADVEEEAGVLFVAEVRTKPTNSPESTIAKIWNECLGAKTIPFDPAAREALIAEGSKHAELKRHIDAWKEMERTGSKWVTGG